MKKIGLVDFFIDEWHSNNYIPWIDELCCEYGYDFKVKYAWAETDTFPDKISTDEWCEKFGVEKCNSIEELCEKSDYIMILAPANPEKHLKYAETVLKYGKNTYIDKTFAPNLKEAKAIYDLGEKYGTKFFSTSALRYADELKEHVSNLNSVIIRGGGRSFQEYIIHQIEMAVKMMGKGAEKVKVLNGGNQRICSVKYPDDKSIFFEYSPCNPFAITTESKNENAQIHSISSDYFKSMLKSILEFFESGDIPFEKEQTLEVIAIRDALLKAENNPDEWVEIFKK